MTTSDRTARLHEYYRANGIPIPQPDPETKREAHALWDSLRDPGDPPIQWDQDDATNKGRATA
jgi:hypothetical protein